MSGLFLASGAPQKGTRPSVEHQHRPRRDVVATSSTEMRDNVVQHQWGTTLSLPIKMEDDIVLNLLIFIRANSMQYKSDPAMANGTRIRDNAIAQKNMQNAKHKPDIGQT